MKLIKIPGQTQPKHILTPWLSFEEAATYCGISRETFRKIIAKNPLPAAGDKHNRKYHSAVLDTWWESIPTSHHQ